MLNDQPRPGDVVGQITQVELEALQAQLSGLDTLTELLYRYLAFADLDSALGQREIEGLALSAKGLVGGAQHLVGSLQCRAPGDGRGGDA